MKAGNIKVEVVYVRSSLTLQEGRIEYHSLCTLVAKKLSFCYKYGQLSGIKSTFYVKRNVYFRCLIAREFFGRENEQENIFTIRLTRRPGKTPYRESRKS